MPEWLYFLLLAISLSCCGICLFLVKVAYNYGYEDGLEDSRAFGRHVDEVLRDDLSRP